MMVLYPLTSAIIIVIAQLAHTRAEISDHPEQAAMLWRRYKSFCYLWAVLLVATAFVGHFWLALPVSP